MKRYLGDGAYVDFDGYNIVLTTSDGLSDTNTIVLEPQTYAALVEYVDDLREGTTVAAVTELDLSRK